jgi:hypothetical protein
MQQDTTYISVNQFILDCTDVSSRLDSVPRADRVAIAEALEKGHLDYAVLLYRRRLMSVSTQDAALIQVILDGLRARLKFLERRA